ncbi:carbamoyltransferase C-terminal domain-containing protein [Mariprofundus sp. KV]|uniref:carbamoyltransferase family protein n=1 Tax=Mariprofundus sp. KV TaxID=2608715 RepID=UPI0015A01B38|nr:carbamoyltransferase C-terminal domain-containing protein [Mariprofundus sp. KV]NWF35535.1 carbamoyltransferase [Mariprofundus sp. KV]
MNILGINAYHGDSSACLVVDGKLVAAVEEERFRRIKHWAGFPSESIRYCLEEAGISLGDVAVVAINSDPKANLMKKIGFTLKKRPEFGLIMDRLKNQKERRSIEQELAHAFPEQSFNGEVRHIEHHLAHLSSAFHVSPYDEAAVVSVDGFGDFASASWGIGRGSEISIDDKVYFPHSMGTFYQALTQFIGFPHYGDEYKVMGLAPYGEPAYMDQMRQIVLLQDDGSFKLNLDYFRHHREKVDYEWENGIPSVGRLFSDKMAELLGPVREKGEELTQRHKDIAHSVQKMYEETFFHLLNKLHARHGSDNLCIAGGCGMNSVANGKVRRNTPFKQVYIQSAAGDAGGAIGAAYSVCCDQPGFARSFVMDHAYFGPSFDNTVIADLLDSKRKKIMAEGCSVELIEDESLLCTKTAIAISEGKVIGWFQGRMEWGPRALGNRSILGDPRRDDMKDILNLKIKRRESFRPFAPSILRDAVADWFEEDDEVPFMMKVFQIREEKRGEIPAVTHADGSGRLQTVYEHTNPRYHQLISAFGEQTGVPILLNTSFNENEPVVCRPEEALDCFLRTKMDLLVLGDWFIERK